MKESFEEAIQETASGKMDSIISSHEKFQDIEVIMKILCKELGIPVGSSIQAINEALGKVFKDHQKAMEDFKTLTGGKVQKAFKDAVNEARK